VPRFEVTRPHFSSVLIGRPAAAQDREITRRVPGWFGNCLEADGGDAMGAYWKGVSGPHACHVTRAGSETPGSRGCGPSRQGPAARRRKQMVARPLVTVQAVCFSAKEGAVCMVQWHGPAKQKQAQSPC
jgi:hypothetical protein